MVKEVPPKLYFATLHSLTLGIGDLRYAQALICTGGLGLRAQQSRSPQNCVPPHDCKTIKIALPYICRTLLDGFIDIVEP